MSVMTLVPAPARHPSVPTTTAACSRPRRRRRPTADTVGATRACCAPRPRGAAQRRRRRRGRAAHLGAAVPQRRPDQRRRAACRAGCRRPPAARRSPILRGQQRAIPSEDVADRVGPDDTDLAAALMDERAAPRPSRGGERCRRPSACSCARCCASPRPTTRSAASWASRGAASARCGAAPSARCAPSSSPASPDRRPGRTSAAGWPFSTTCLMPCRIASAIVRSGWASTVRRSWPTSSSSSSTCSSDRRPRGRQRQLDRRHAVPLRARRPLDYRATLAASAAACARLVTWSLCRTRDT